MRTRILKSIALLATGAVVGGAAVWFLRPPRPATPELAPVSAPPDAAFPTRWGDRGSPAFGANPADVRLTSDGRRLMVGWFTGVRAWDLDTGHTVTLHAHPDRSVYAPTLSPDGRWVVGVRGSEPDWHLVAWDAATGAEVRAVPAHSWRNGVLGFDPGGAAWVVRAEGVAELVDVPSLTAARALKVPFDPRAWGRLAVSPDGRWLVIGGGTVFAARPTDPARDWVVVERHAEVPTDDLPQPTRCPIPCGFAPDGRRLVTYDRSGGVVALWELGDRPSKVTERAAGLTPWTHLDDLTFTPDGRRFAFRFVPDAFDRADPQLCVWDSQTLVEVGRVTPAGGFQGFAFTPDGRRVVLAQPDGTLTVRDVPGGERPPRGGG